MTMKTYIGIDNGVTGAIAALGPNDRWLFHPVDVVDCGKDRILDVHQNLAFIRDVEEMSGGTSGIVVVYEQQKKNPVFGTKGNFANGRNGEFWRVLLTLSAIPFTWVDPNTWQRDVLKGIPGTDTKMMAKLFLDQRFPEVPLATYNKSKQEAIRDAMCIAVWARSQNK